MSTQRDVSRIALSLPAAEKVRERIAFGVRCKGKLKEFARERLLAERPDVLFTEPHYNGFPAVLVRLDAIGTADLRLLITEAWKCQAPSDLKRPSPPASTKLRAR